MKGSDKKRAKRETHLWPLGLGIVVGVVLVITAAFAFELAFDTNAWQEFSGTLPALIALLIALMSLLISYRMYQEQQLVRQAGTDPVVLVYLGSREDARLLSTLEIENVGAGAARNVQVTLVTDVSSFVPDPIITDFTKLKRIKTIPQGKSVSYNFGLGHKLLKEAKIPVITFSVEYEDIEGNSRFDEQSIDVSELTGQRADESLMSRIAKSLEKLEKSAKAGFPSNSANHVVVQSIEEHCAEQIQMNEELQARYEQKKDQS